jgi:3-oxoacyl-[acyl-carrier-protein] synthase-3
MKSVYQNKKISGIYTVVPANRVAFEDEVSNYLLPIDQSLRLKKVMGFGAHRIVKGQSCASDMAVAGLEDMFKRGLLQKESVSALLFISQTPDAPMPPTSNMIQGRLGLPQSTLCLDINQGCAGFIVGIMLGFALLDNPTCDSVILINADTLSRKCSPHDRNIYPMIGDAAAITVLKRSDDPIEAWASVNMDGSRAGALQIPAGGLRIPSSLDTAELIDLGDGNRRALDHFFMEGSDVFNFVITEVPKLIDELLIDSSKSKSEIEFFLFHQPNKFILQKLASQANIESTKMFSNIVEEFGNSSSATIPMNICHNLKDVVTERPVMVMMSGFGVGLTWGGIVTNLGKLDFCELHELDF